MIDGGSLLNHGIDFGQSYPGGWKIANVDINHFEATGVHAEQISLGARGLWITGSNISNITGMPISPTATPGLVAGYGWATGTAVAAAYVRNVFIDATVATDTDTPYWITACDDCMLLNSSAIRSYYLQVYIAGGYGSSVNSHRVLYKGGVIDSLGSVGSSGFGGAAGIMCGITTDVIVDGTEIKNTFHSHGDGWAFDFEVLCKNTLLRNINAHDNADTALLFFRSDASGQASSGSMVIDNTFTSNGSWNSGEPAISRCVPNSDRIVFARNNTTRRLAGAQLLFGAGSGGTNTDTATTYMLQSIYGSDNTVH